MASQKAIRLLSCLQPATCRIGLLLLHCDFADKEWMAVEPQMDILRTNTALLCAVDSGANFLYDKFHSALKKEAWFPDLLSGDFDSIRPEVMEHFRRNSSTKVVHTPDQDETDFTKALQLMLNTLESKGQSVDSIVAVTSGNGRLDHIMANINTLFKAHLWTDISVILFSGNQLQFALNKTVDYELKLDVGLEGPLCGLVPVAGPCHAVTSGLKWDLTSQRMEFGGLISTSNEVASSIVRIRTDRPLLWTMSIKEAVPRSQQTGDADHSTQSA